MTISCVNEFLSIRCYLIYQLFFGELKSRQTCIKRNLNGLRSS